MMDHEKHEKHESGPEDRFGFLNTESTETDRGNGSVGPLPWIPWVPCSRIRPEGGGPGCTNEFLHGDGSGIGPGGNSIGLLSWLSCFSWSIIRSVPPHPHRILRVLGALCDESSSGRSRGGGERGDSILSVWSECSVVKKSGRAREPQLNDRVVENGKPVLANAIGERARRRALAAVLDNPVRAAGGRRGGGRQADQDGAGGARRLRGDQPAARPVVALGGRPGKTMDQI